MIQNDKQHIQFRRCRDTLSVVGTGIILFSAWSVIKMIGLFLLNPENLTQTISESFQEHPNSVPESTFFLIVFVLIFILIALDVWVHFYVGLSAVAAARGKTLRPLFFTLTGILILYSSFTIMALLFSIYKGYGSVYEDIIASLIIELTYLVMLIEMAAAAAKVMVFPDRKKQEIQ